MTDDIDQQLKESLDTWYTDWMESMRKIDPKRVEFYDNLSEDELLKKIEAEDY